MSSQISSEMLNYSSSSLTVEEEQKHKRKRPNSEFHQTDNPLHKIETLSFKLLSQCKKFEREVNYIGGKLCLPCHTEIKKEASPSSSMPAINLPPSIAFNKTDEGILSKIEIQMSEVDLLIQKTHESMKDNTSCEACRFSYHDDSMFA